MNIQDLGPHQSLHARHLLHPAAAPERCFAERWARYSSVGRHMLDFILADDQSPLLPPECPPDAYQYAATLIQWLGTDVGVQFLVSVLYDCPELRQRFAKYGCVVTDGNGQPSAARDCETVLAYLNTALERTPEHFRALISARRFGINPTEAALSPVIFAPQPDGQYSMSVLGILNGLLTRLQGWRVVAVTDADDNITGFWEAGGTTLVPPWIPPHDVIPDVCVDRAAAATQCLAAMPAAERLKVLRQFCLYCGRKYAETEETCACQEE